jgi:hypothetical protein
MEILARNVNDALAQGLREIVASGLTETSRNGSVLVFRNPVLTTYIRPEQRVVFSPLRNANPFFHLMESLWMLGGRNDLAFPLQFNSRFKEYSDDGNTLAGAYGFRWRKYFGRDQLELAVRELVRVPDTRRVVIQMWAANDLGGTGKDLPCNTQIFLDCRHNQLNMTVTNRSNDILWGAYGANAVHFSILLEYLAALVELPIGVYRQFSNNLHLYTEVLPPPAALKMADDVELTDHYRTHEVYHKPMIVDPGEWDHELQLFLRYPDKHKKYREPFFRDVARPMYEAWTLRHDTFFARSVANNISASDWRRACREWLERFHQRRQQSA